MRLQAAVLVLAASALGGCDSRRDGGDPPEQAAAEAAPSARSARDPAPATVGEAASGAPGVEGPAPGAIGFEGFGPARFGDPAEAVRQAWDGDLGEERPMERGGCHYLVPRPLRGEGDGIAFMIEGDRFVRIDVRDPAITAPGGARVGLAGDEVRALYPGVEALPHKYDPAGGVLRVGGPGGGVLVMELDGDGRVDAWRIGVPPQVDYVEGCS